MLEKFSFMTRIQVWCVSLPLRCGQCLAINVSRYQLRILLATKVRFYSIILQMRHSVLLGRGFPTFLKSGPGPVEFGGKFDIQNWETLMQSKRTGPPFKMD